MSNWNNPTTGSTYANYTDEIRARDNDLALGLDPATTAPANLPIGAIRWTSANKRWERYDGTTWAPLENLYAISISGNAATATAAGSATHLAGGAAGSLPYQAAANTTAMLAASTNGYILSLVSGVPAWIANSPTFPTGTRMSFNQTAAPTGWTKDTTAALDDSIMRIVTGSVSSGGSTAFSAFNGQTATAAHTLTTAEIPAHTHGVTDPGHSHTFVAILPGGNYAAYSNIAGPGTGTTSASATGITIQNTGGGAAHTHSITTAIKYNDFIIASKN